MMRTILVHNFYLSSSTAGEDVVYRSELIASPIPSTPEVQGTGVAGLPKQGIVQFDIP